MKILGVVFQSKQQPTRLALFSDKIETFQEGIARATIAINREHGQLEWNPVITQMREFPDITPAQVSPLVIKGGDETTSLIMKTIINNKDAILFDAAKKYFSEPEVLY